MSAPTTASPASELSDLVGRDRIVGEAETREWTVAGRRPAAVAFPRTAEEASAVLARATERGWCVEPAGAGRWLRAGTPGPPPDVVLSTAHMDRIVQYEPGDLTVTAEAGCPLATLSRRAGEEAQWLPVDPPGTGGTLGAAVATGTTGPLTAGFGPLRDRVLGLTLVTGDGRVLELGGRVVKNVAGFDLVRLVVGSRGTLGLVTSVTVLLHPRPDVVRTLALEGGSARELVGAARAAATAPVVPASVELLERRVGSSDPRGARLLVRLAGGEEKVRHERRVLADVVGAELEALDEEDAAAAWRESRELEEERDLALRLALPPSRLDELLELAGTLGRVRPGRDALGRSDLRLAVHAASGVLRVAVPNVRTDTGWDEDWAGRLGDLRRTLELRGGSLVVSHGPPQVVEKVGAWGDPGAAGRLMARLKEQFDPGGVLAPGRFVLPPSGAHAAGT